MGRQRKAPTARAKRSLAPGPLVASRYGPDERATLFLGDCFDLLASIPDNTVDLTVTSPPYCIGKRYEQTRSVHDFEATHKRLAPEIARVTKPGGSVCWQVGYHVEDGVLTPLDALVYPLF